MHHLALGDGLVGNTPKTRGVRGCAVVLWVVHRFSQATHEIFTPTMSIPLLLGMLLPCFPRLPSFWGLLGRSWRSEVETRCIDLILLAGSVRTRGGKINTKDLDLGGVIKFNPNGCVHMVLFYLPTTTTKRPTHTPSPRLTAHHGEWASRPDLVVRLSKVRPGQVSARSFVVRWLQLIDKNKKTPPCVCVWRDCPIRMVSLCRPGLWHKN